MLRFSSPNPQVQSRCALAVARQDQKQYGEELRRIGAKWGSNRLMVAMLAMLLDAVHGHTRTARLRSG